MLYLFLVYVTLRQHQTTVEKTGKEQIKHQLKDSLGYNENVDKEELIMYADTVKDCQEALNIIKENKQKKHNMLFLPRSF